MTAENGQNGEQMGNGKMVAFKFFSKDFCRILFSIVDIYQSIYAMKCLKSTDKKIKKNWYAYLVHFGMTVIIREYILTT